MSDLEKNVKNPQVSAAEADEARHPMQRTLSIALVRMFGRHVRLTRFFMCILVGIGLWNFRFTLLFCVQAVSLYITSNPYNLPVVLGLIGIAVMLSLWLLPKQQAEHSKGASIDNYFDRENESRKTLAQIIGGILLLVSLYSSVKTFDLQQQGQITDRYTKATDQLGSWVPGVDAHGNAKINLEVRLGGIYALERISEDSPRDHWTIMEVLTAYVRQNAPASGCGSQHDLLLRLEGKEGLPPAHEDKLAAPADIQAILTVVGRRNINYDPPDRVLDFHGANLGQTSLRNARLEGANFYGADLTGSDLSEAFLDGADLRTLCLDSGQLSTAKGNLMTRLPSSLTRPSEWILRGQMQDTVKKFASTDKR